MEKVDLYKYEKELWASGVNCVAGVDEAGRGPLVGPVVAACVVLPCDFVLDGLNDSKKLTEKKRNCYYDYIIEHALAVELGIVDNNEIDKINIYQASKKAMLIAIEKVSHKLKLEYILIDAMPLETSIPNTSIIKGDSKSISIAAASVIAKVTRDKMMDELDLKYPCYGFKNHKGYPTKKHLEALKHNGVISEYRKTYGPVKGVLNENKTN